VSQHCRKTLPRSAADVVLSFDANRETLSLIAQMIEAERRCCQFLRFHLTVEPSCGPISLELTGPPGTQAFLDALLEPA
jgi:hypothetical protein